MIETTHMARGKMSPTNGWGAQSEVGICRDKIRASKLASSEVNLFTQTMPDTDGVRFSERLAPRSRHAELVDGGRLDPPIRVFRSDNAPR